MLDGSDTVVVSRVIACGDSAEIFEFVEETLTCPTEVAHRISWNPAIVVALVDHLDGAGQTRYISITANLGDRVSSPATGTTQIKKIELTMSAFHLIALASHQKVAFLYSKALLICARRS